jgi:hypothetical protein
MAAACVALLATACGSGHSASFAPTTVNAATDRAAAAAINLTAADLPGWQSSPNQTSSSDRALAARLAACAGAANPSTTDVVDMSSPNFDQGNAEASSDVTTVHTAAQGTQDLQAMRSSKLGTCVTQIGTSYIQSTLPSGTTLTALNLVRLRPANSPPNSFAFRLSVTVSVPNQGNVAINSDTIGFLVGRAQIELDVTQTGGTPDPALEQRLLALLVGRAHQPLG